MGVELQQVSKVFLSRQRETRALSDVTFTVEDEAFVCIVGPSGCGKSTLLRIIAGLTEPTSGRITFRLRPIPHGMRSAMVFQEPALYPWMTVTENAAFGLEMQGAPPRAARSRAEAYLERIGLGDFLESFPRELSGGMRQRVAIARAVLADPQMLLMDEPFGALDAQTRLLLQEDLLHIWEKLKKTVLYVTHDIEEALLLADRVVVLSGRPARVREIVQVPEPRAERHSGAGAERLHERMTHIWRLIEDEVRRELHIEKEADAHG